jgi:periplasmic copper chaperone A
MTLLLRAAILGLLAVPALAQSGGVTVERAWARATAPSAKTGGAYLTLTDHGAADQLVGISTPVAATAEVHETTNDNGIMRMRAVPSLALEPGRSVTLEPGGYHVMLIGLTQTLKRGESFPMTLTFAHAPPVTVQVSVAGPGATSMDHPGGMHDGMPGMQSMPGMQNMPGMAPK